MDKCLIFFREWTGQMLNKEILLVADAVSNEKGVDREVIFEAIECNLPVICTNQGGAYEILDSGNNANLRPNMRLYYLETILPIVRKLNFALSRYFGFNITENVTDIPALQPELRDAAAYYTALVNGGIITINEARDKLGYEIIEGQDEIRVPQNIAGSAVNPDEGGRPPESEGD